MYNDAYYAQTAKFIKEIAVWGEEKGGGGGEGRGERGGGGGEWPSCQTEGVKYGIDNLEWTIL